MTDEEKKKIKETADNTVDEVTGYVLAASEIVNVENEWKDQADTIKEQAEILAKAQNAIGNATEEKPFVPDKEDRELFDQVNSFVEAANDILNGCDEANKRHLRHLDEADDPREWNPEAVIDEKIKEEQKEGEEEDLRDEIVDSFE